jgi:Domain of unknown function (DUF955).
MNKYEELIQETTDLGLTIKEKPLKASDGRIKRNRVAIRSTIPTTTQKTCVLAEELGHYHTSYGNIIDFNQVSNRKQEQRARLWAYNKMVGLMGLVKAYEKSCQNLSEMADYLGVTEEFLNDAINYYATKYGTHTTVDNYIVFFAPNFGVLKLM